ncbi:MAG: hypothetical protein ABIE68_01440 [bacterium]
MTVKDTIQKVKDAEIKARKNISNSEEEAKKIILEAKEKAVNRLESVKKDANKQMGSIVDDAKKNAELELKKMKEEKQAGIDKTTAKISSNKKEAVNYIWEKLIN